MFGISFSIQYLAIRSFRSVYDLVRNFQSEILVIIFKSCKSLLQNLSNKMNL